MKRPDALQRAGALWPLEKIERLISIGGGEWHVIAFHRVHGSRVHRLGADGYPDCASEHGCTDVYAALDETPDA